MFRGLIDYLTYTYSFIAKARGRLHEQEIESVRDGARVVARNADSVLGADQVKTSEDVKDLREAELILQHIEELTVYQTSMEIV